MELSTQERQFLEHRTQRVKAWKYVGPLLVVITLGGTLWLLIGYPLLANPFIVLSRLERGSIPLPTLTLMAGLLPIAVLTGMFLAMVMVLFIFAMVSNERKYLTIIQKNIDNTRIPPESGL